MSFYFPPLALLMGPAKSFKAHLRWCLFQKAFFAFLSGKHPLSPLIILSPSPDLALCAASWVSMQVICEFTCISTPCLPLLCSVAQRPDTTNCISQRYVPTDFWLGLVGGMDESLVGRKRRESREFLPLLCFGERHLWQGLRPPWLHQVAPAPGLQSLSLPVAWPALRENGFSC